MTETNTARPTHLAPDEIRFARAWLALAAEPGNRDLWWLVEDLGPVQAMEVIRAGEVGGPIKALVGGRAEQLTDKNVEAAMARAAAATTRFVVPEDSEWPQVLNSPLGEFQSAPLGLWVRGYGDLARETKTSVAIVGSRASTAYGEHVAGELGHQLGNKFERVVVSGGAYGIDAAAHRGAIAADCRTVAVLACGVDRPYPAAHGALFHRIVDDGGLLVSEYAPGSAPLRHRFLSRNGLIAALGEGMVVVEAAARSGALQAANRAKDIGRVVMAVPGPVTSAMSVGCHMLLRDGALLVTSAADVDAAIRAGF